MTRRVQLIDLYKDYALKGETISALRGISLEVPEGDYLAIMGPSGSGKSTMLNLLGCLDRPTSGQLILGQENVVELNDDQLADLRANHIGFVFQSFNLIAQLSLLENIEVPMLYQARGQRLDHRKSRQLAQRVGLEDRMNHRPSELSGGQQQRVAIARSLVNDPDFVLADEPTGNLDSRTTEEILGIFDELNDEGRTIFLVTHEDEVAAHAKRIVRLHDGRIQSIQEKLA